MGKRIGRPPIPIEERFWKRVRKSEGCWEWQGARSQAGYGTIASPLTPISRVHRLSWALHNGPIPAGLHVLHRCDNPPCVRPDHLFLGTDADNNADKIAKGRCYTGDHAGTRNPNAKLTDDQVRDIRLRFAGGVSKRRLSKEFGMSRMTIIRVVKREAWSHVL